MKGTKNHPQSEGRSVQIGGGGSRSASKSLTRNKPRRQLKYNEVLSNKFGACGYQNLNVASLEELSLGGVKH